MDLKKHRCNHAEYTLRKRDDPQRWLRIFKKRSQLICEHDFLLEQDSMTNFQVAEFRLYPNQETITVSLSQPQTRSMMWGKNARVPKTNVC